ncbi:MAG: hypothetical protein HW416_3888, partial [Chloroflexi bacterium]|nr:hypothetical protein [Chloroflexota bacterium]
AQRVGPLSLITSPRFQAWLRSRNAARWNVYVSVNVLTPAKRSRTRDAVRAVRHLFLEADHDAPVVLAKIAARPDLPRPSYVLHSSPNRAHVFWRVTDFTVDATETLQRQLARELQTDHAATPCTQTTRLPGFFNHKYQPAHLVTVEYPTDALERARRYLSALPPAIAGQHGDLHTFRVCCRLVRGFAMPDADALSLLAEWNARCEPPWSERELTEKVRRANARCEPPWSERELTEKVRRARRYGREPIGGLLEAQP